jgi:hypothetical protein
MQSTNSLALVANEGQVVFMVDHKYFQESFINQLYMSPIFKANQDLQFIPAGGLTLWLNPKR